MSRRGAGEAWVGAHFTLHYSAWQPHVDVVQLPLAACPVCPASPLPLALAWHALSSPCAQYTACLLPALLFQTKQATTAVPPAPRRPAHGDGARHQWGERGGGLSQGGAHRQRARPWRAARGARARGGHARVDCTPRHRWVSRRLGRSAVAGRAAGGWQEVGGHMAGRVGRCKGCLRQRLEANRVASLGSEPFHGW